MLGRRPHAACAITARYGATVLIVLGMSSSASAETVKHAHLPSFRDVEATASVTLDRLSVGLLRVDRPWNPRVCIGCDHNNGSAYSRLGARRSR